MPKRLGENCSTIPTTKSFSTTGRRRTSPTASSSASVWLASSSTPSGTARIGAFEIQRDGTWKAWIEAPSGKDGGADQLTVATGVERVAAIVALWRARTDAFFKQCSL